MAPNDRMLRAALGCAENGLSVIPLRPNGKQPLVRWSGYQQTCASRETIIEWWRKFPNANIGIVTGHVSGIVVIDCDGPEGLAEAEAMGIAECETFVVETGKGRHYYFKHPGVSVPNAVRLRPGVDVRGDGGYVVAAPSVHENGTTYTVVRPAPPAACPTSILAAAQYNAKHAAPTTDAYAAAALQGEVAAIRSLAEGSRNSGVNTAAFNLGQLVGAGKLDRSRAEEALLAEARSIGLGDAEAVATIRSGIEAGLARPRATRQGGVEGVVPFSIRDLPIDDYRLENLTRGEAPPRKWVIEGAIPQGVPGVMYGAGGIGKSMAALDLCLKIAARIKAPVDIPTFLGPIHEGGAGATVFITLEDSRDELHRRTCGLDPNGLRDGAPCYVLPAIDIPGFDPVLVRGEKGAGKLTGLAVDGLEQLIGNVQAKSGHPVRLVCLDPAGDLIEGDESSAAVIQPLMRRLREISARHNVAILLLGHVPKGETDRYTLGQKGMRGSGAWIANARFAIGAYAPGDGEKLTVLQKLELAITRQNLDRVVFAQITKANFPHRGGMMEMLRDLQTGLWVDFSDAVQNRDREQENKRFAALVETVRDAAAGGSPFQATGSQGLFKRLNELPVILQLPQKRLERLANQALQQGQIRKCKKDGKGAPCWLDVPGGALTTGEEQYDAA